MHAKFNYISAASLRLCVCRCELIYNLFTRSSNHRANIEQTLNRHRTDIEQTLSKHRANMKHA